MSNKDMVFIGLTEDQLDELVRLLQNAPFNDEQNETNVKIHRELENTLRLAGQRFMPLPGEKV
jgi:hypothetical protein